MILIELEKALVEPVSVAEAKAWARIERDDEDTAIAHLVAAAREAVERETGLVLVRRAFRLVIDEIPTDGVVRVPRGPLHRVREVRAYDEAGTEEIADAGLVPIEGETIRIAPELREAASLEVELEAGGDALAEGLRQAILRIVASSYETRGLVGDAMQPALVPPFARALLAPFRRVRL